MKALTHDSLGNGNRKIIKYKLICLLLPYHHLSLRHNNYCFYSFWVLKMKLINMTKGLCWHGSNFLQTGFFWPCTMMLRPTERKSLLPKMHPSFLPTKAVHNQVLLEPNVLSLKLLKATLSCCVPRDDYFCPSHVEEWLAWHSLKQVLKHQNAKVGQNVTWRFTREACQTFKLSLFDECAPKPTQKGLSLSRMKK
jgi:hypothetical protein